MRYLSLVDEEVEYDDGTTLQIAPLDCVDGVRVVRRYFPWLLWLAALAALLGLAWAVGVEEEAWPGVLGLIAAVILWVLYLVTRHSIVQVHAGNMVMTEMSSGSLLGGEEFARDLIARVQDSGGGPGNPYAPVYHDPSRARSGAEAMAEMGLLDNEESRCEVCNMQLAPDVRFCTGCGAAVG